VVRKLEQYFAEKARIEADDRNLISRSEERREKQQVEAALFALATKLANLKPRQLDRLELAEPLLAIIAEIRVIDNPAARHRATKRLRAQLRDGAVEDLERRLAALTDPQASRVPDEATLWRDRLTTGNDGVLAEFVAACPQADRAQLRALIRNSVRAKEPERPRAAKKLLQAIRSALRAPSQSQAEFAPGAAASEE
jgi:ribosomal 50S subunit-associated protein YjgA (DUF615 family)